MATSAETYHAKEIAAGRLTAAMLSMAERHGGVSAVQSHYGLTADGLAGAKTQQILAALVAGKTPIPYGRNGVLGAYGDFRWREGKGGRIDIDDAWEAAHIAAYRLHTGRTVMLHRAVGEEFVALFRAACQASGYTPASVQTHVPRHTLWDPAKPLSLHSWGIAVDFDPTSNPMGGKGSKLRTPAGALFVQVFRDAGWTWGGDWKMKDDMHFQRAYA
jgi:hypothetical protein